MKQIRHLFRYVQKSSEKKQQLEALIQKTIGDLQGVFNGLSYAEIIHFSNRIIRSLESYMDDRSPIEVYTAVKAWRVEEKTGSPYRLIATLDPAAWYDIDRAVHIAQRIHPFGEADFAAFQPGFP